jgi:hypothetical protein
MAVDTMRLRSGNPPTLDLEKSTTTIAVLVGDMVKVASGTADKADAIADNLAFAGVAMTSSDAGSSDTFRIWRADGLSEYDFPLDTATTVAVFDLLRIDTANSDAQTLKLCASTTDPVAVCTRAGTDATTVRCAFLLPQAFTVGDAS